MVIAQMTPSKVEKLGLRFVSDGGFFIGKFVTHPFRRCHDTEHSDTQHNNTKYT